VNKRVKGKVVRLLGKVGGRLRPERNDQGEKKNLPTDKGRGEKSINYRNRSWEKTGVSPYRKVDFGRLIAWKKPWGGIHKVRVVRK